VDILPNSKGAIPLRAALPVAILNKADILPNKEVILLNKEVILPSKGAIPLRAALPVVLACNHMALNIITI
jgi:hypothetical protein